MTLKFYASVAKELKLRLVWGLSFTFLEFIWEKLVGFITHPKKG